MKQKNNSFGLLLLYLFGISNLCRGIQISHKELSSTGSIMGYKDLKLGLCAGFSMACAIYLLINQEAPTFSELEILSNYITDKTSQTFFSSFLSTEEVVNAIDPRLALDISNAQEKVTNNRSLCANDHRLLALKLFFDKVDLYQDPTKYRHLFSPEFANNEDIETIINKVKPPGLENIQVQLVFDKLMMLKQGEIEHLLDELASIADCHQLTLPALLTNIDHRVFLAYIPSKKSWISRLWPFKQPERVGKSMS